MALLLLVVMLGLASCAPLIAKDAMLGRAQLTARVVAGRDGSAKPHPPRAPAESLAEYVDRFPMLTQNATDLEGIFASAERHHISLAKGEYQLKSERDAPFVVYTATFPLRTDYSAVKEFAADVLLNLPHASLDELRLSRETAGAEVLDSVVRFTLTYRSR